MHTHNRALRRWRKAQGLTQTEAGRRFRIRQSVWSRIETGGLVLKPVVAQKIAKATGLRLEQLLGLS